MKGLLKYILPCLVCLGSSCDKQEQPNGGNGQQVDIRIDLDALDETVPVRLIVSDALNGHVLINRYPLEMTGPTTVALRTGRSNIYILGNEFAHMTPLLDDIKLESMLRDFIVERTDLPDEEGPAEPPDGSNLPLMKAASVLVRARLSDPESGEISTDNGATWGSSLDMGLQRLAIRVDLGLRKHTDVATDVIHIRQVRIINIPRYGYWIGQGYDAPDFGSPESVFTGDLEIVHTGSNGDPQPGDFDPVFEDCILPEYIMPLPTSADNAMSLQITALYNGRSVIYRVPLRADVGIEDYSLRRNKHFRMMGTIRSEGEMLDEVLYSVEDWTDSANGFEIGKTIAFDSRWEEGTNVVGNDVRVANNEALEHIFTLNAPKGASWTATLTNPIDFMFDYSDGAVSGGVTEEAFARTIRIMPRRETFRNDVHTEFYITVNNGSGNMELDLPNAHVGGGNRYVITQIPN